MESDSTQFDYQTHAIAQEAFRKAIQDGKSIQEAAAVARRALVEWGLNMPKAQ